MPLMDDLKKMDDQHNQKTHSSESYLTRLLYMSEDRHYSDKQICDWVDMNLSVDPVFQDAKKICQKYKI